jgi:hypothetical protein
MVNVITNLKGTDSRRGYFKVFTTKSVYCLYANGFHNLIKEEEEEKSFREKKL